MTEINTLLELRTRIKEKKPDFIRQDYGRRKRINSKWRKPKGIHSKIRHHFKGRRKMPSPGYKSPVAVKGLHSSGLRIVNVHSVDGIKQIKNLSEGAIIAKSVGLKKKLAILRMAKELNVNILNLNIDEHIKRIEEFISSKKSKAKETKKEETKKEPKEAKEKKEEIKPTDESKKEIEKKEKDKILTKKV